MQREVGKEVMEREIDKDFKTVVTIVASFGIHACAFELP